MRIRRDVEDVGALETPYGRQIARIIGQRVEGRGGGGEFLVGVFEDAAVRVEVGAAAFEGAGAGCGVEGWGLVVPYVVEERGGFGVVDSERVVVLVNYMTWSLDRDRPTHFSEWPGLMPTLAKLISLTSPHSGHSCTYLPSSSQKSMMHLRCMK